ncbi:MAG: hypothetical protein RI894_427 [Bacteroidota bacterium]|jgi:hypothetical protein
MWTYVVQLYKLLNFSTYQPKENSSTHQFFRELVGFFIYVKFLFQMQQCCN